MAPEPPHPLFNTTTWFTGLPPKPNICPGINPATGTISSLPLPNLLTSCRDDILAYFNNTWTLQETLFAGLRTRSAFYRRPDHGLRHPMIFYYGHTAVFYINKFRLAGLIPDEPLNARFETLLEVGVDENAWDDMSQEQKDWPDLEEVHAYRRKVYGIVRDVIERMEFGSEFGRAVEMGDPAWAVVMAFEHERIHLETSSVLIREMPVELLERHRAWPGPAENGRREWERRLEVRNEMISVSGGEVRIGKPLGFPSFGWDNEYSTDKRPTKVEAFEASRYLITNGEFCQYVEAGGYQKKDYWSESGWAQHRNKKPRFWRQDTARGAEGYKLRTIFEEVEMPWDWPVVVDYHEASAYCAWRSRQDEQQYRLISEAEHYRLRDRPSGSDEPQPENDVIMFHTGSDLNRTGINLGLAFGSETPVDASPLTKSGFGDVFGNVWQWCEDAFAPLPGFEPHPYYQDFSTPFYEGEHKLLLGGCFASTGDQGSIWNRTPFRPHFLQHSGFRIVRSPVSDRNGTASI